MQRLSLSILVLALVSCSTRDSGGCPSGRVSCPVPGGMPACVTTTSDVQNCGACGVHCATGEGCISGHCGGLHDMGPLTDLGPHDSGPRTDSGPVPSLCMPTCSAAQRCCGVQCVARTWAGGAMTDGSGDSSFLNCGSCGHACDPNTASQCAMGTAGPACECGANNACAAGMNCMASATGGFSCMSDCGGHGACATGTQCCGTGAAGTCIDTHGSDSANCGGCGVACTASQVCQSGRCVDLCGGVACAMGELCCADVCIAEDASNCGGCGVTCPMDDECGMGLSFTMPGSMSLCCLLSGGPPGFMFCDPEASDGGGFPMP